MTARSVIGIFRFRGEVECSEEMRRLAFSVASVIAGNRSPHPYVTSVASRVEALGGGNEAKLFFTGAHGYDSNGNEIFDLTKKGKVQGVIDLTGN